MSESSAFPRGRIVASTAVAALVMLALDLVFIGAVAKPIYDTLGPLKRDEIFAPAAAAFYVMYVAATMRHAVLGAASLGDAARRGAGLGLVAYATYELTNWAVLRDWPSLVVPVDIVWGMALTAVTATLGRAVLERGREPRT